jgi:hypothetical protein
MAFIVATLSARVYPVRRVIQERSLQAVLTETEAGI